jgi:hypothetical protein
MKNKNKGLYNKFTVMRTDGRSEAGEKHDGCRYFVLDLNHDPFCVPALRAYATACQSEYPNLAKDLFGEADDAEDYMGWVDYGAEEGKDGKV